MNYVFIKTKLPDEVLGNKITRLSRSVARVVKLRDYDNEVEVEVKYINQLP